MINVIASSSRGNAIIYNDIALVDVGVSYAKIKPYANQIKVVFLTHKHGDHLKIKTLKVLCKENPRIRIACGSWMVEFLDGINNPIDVLDFGQWYSYGLFNVAMGKLYHDVPNAFYRFDFDGYKVFHATDTAHLEGIGAKNYDLYALEHNYCEEKAEEIIKEAAIKGEYTHVAYSINSHLSVQQAHSWLLKNMNKDSKVIRLHESSTAL